MSPAFSLLLCRYALLWTAPPSHRLPSHLCTGFIELFSTLHGKWCSSLHHYHEKKKSLEAWFGHDMQPNLLVNWLRREGELLLSHQSPGRTTEASLYATLDYEKYFGTQAIEPMTTSFSHNALLHWQGRHWEDHLEREQATTKKSRLFFLNPSYVITFVHESQQ